MPVKFIHGVLIAIISYVLASLLIFGNVNTLDLKFILIAGIIGGVLRKLLP